MSRSQNSLVALYLFGAFRIESPHGARAVPARKAALLLAYLALHPGPQAREKLAALLWGDSPDAQARLSLRVALNKIRTLIPDLLRADAETVEIVFDNLRVDVLEFKRLLDAGLNAFDSTAVVQQIESAVALYQGDLLADFYADWILREREEYRDAYLEALLRLTREMRARGEYPRAIAFAQTVLKTDAANERAHQHLMFCYVAIGNRQAALRQYQECVRLLHAELNVAPMPETTALYEWIKRAPVETLPTEALLTNVPIPVSSFIGRKNERLELTALISTARLVTLTGAGGSGKTRLAIQVARDAFENFRDGVWWVELAALTDDMGVPRAVAKALGVHETPHQLLVETLTNYLRFKELLLILDNCEHLLEACARLAQELLTYCPHLKIMATSRERLGVAGERVYLVPTLSVPPIEAVSLEQALAYEGVELFVERARAVNPNWLTHEAVNLLIQICQRLEGIPLAIELAAARTRVLTLEQIATRLDDRFALLSEGNRAGTPRHQTLRAAVDWSYALLSASEQTLLRRLSVFADGFTLEGVEHVCADDALARSQVLDLILRLADKSLVRVEHQAHAARYHLLETIREYAHEKLQAAGEENEIRARHLKFFISFAERAERELGGAKRLEWFHRLEEEHNNLRAAHEASASLQNGAELGLRLAAALDQFWAWRGHHGEGRRWLEKGLAEFQRDDASSDALRAKALRAAGLLALQQSDFASGHTWLVKSTTLYEKLNEQQGLGHTLLWLAVEQMWLNQFERARPLIAESVALFRSVNDVWSLAYALAYEGGILLYGGEHANARTRLEESLRLFDALGDRWTIEVALAQLGGLMYQVGDYPQARLIFQKGLPIARELDDDWGLAIHLGWLGHIARAEKDLARAMDFYEQELALWRTLGVPQRVVRTILDMGQTALEIGDIARAKNLFEQILRSQSKDIETDAQEFPVVHLALVGIAGIWNARDRSSDAARLLGAAQNFFDAMIAVRYTPFGPVRATEYHQTLAHTRAQLDAATFAEKLREGNAMTLAQAIEYARE